MQFYRNPGNGLNNRLLSTEWRGDAIVVKRTYYKDRYNDNKVWEVVKLRGGYYLRQYICGKQFGRGDANYEKIHPEPWHL